MVKEGTGVFRSGLAPGLLVALTQAGAGGISLRGLARALGRRDSAIQRALPALVDSGFVKASGTSGAPQYALARTHPVAEEMLRVAAHQIPTQDLAQILVRANDAVEFAGLDDGRLVVVYRDGSDPRARLSLEHALRDIAAGRLELDATTHADVSERPAGTAPWSEKRRFRVLKGRRARTFPDRRRRADFEHGQPLGKPHPSLRRLSRRILQRLAREHGLSRLALFGSSVRSDFRPDSDVDVLVRRRPGTEASLIDDARLQQDLEQLFDRDVDVVEEERLLPRFRPLAQRDRVVLYGRP